MTDDDENYVFNQYKRCAFFILKFYNEIPDIKIVDFSFVFVDNSSLDINPIEVLLFLKSNQNDSVRVLFNKFMLFLYSNIVYRFIRPIITFLLSRVIDFNDDWECVFTVFYPNNFLIKMRVLMYFKVSFDNDAFFFEVELLNYKI